jgi:hypothetical protein
MVIERWDDVPPPSQNMIVARDRIRTHVEQLVATLKHADAGTPYSAKERLNDNSG